MLFSSDLTTDQILDAFTDEIAARGGQVIDTFNDGRRLLTRALLDRADQVQPGDKVQGGVALKAGEEELRVYPYVFRQVCSNGAIVAETIGSLVVEKEEFRQMETVLDSIREAAAVCCGPEVFAGNVRRMRDARADAAINMLTTIDWMRSRGHEELVSLVMEEFFRHRDRSRFGLANAVTAVARDQRDPDARWDLEELGGGIACAILPRGPSDRGRARIERRKKLVGAV